MYPGVQDYQASYYIQKLLILNLNLNTLVF